jgi:hypothetical protein
MPHSLYAAPSAKEEKVRLQFTRPAKFLFNSADLGSKAFSYIISIPNSFLHCDARHRPNESRSLVVLYPFFISFSRLSFIHVRLYPSVIYSAAILPVCHLRFYSYVICDFTVVLCALCLFIYSCRPFDCLVIRDPPYF